MLLLRVQPQTMVNDAAYTALPRTRRIAAMRFGLAGTYDPKTQYFESFDSTDDDLIDLVDYLTFYPVQGVPLAGLDIVPCDLVILQHELARRHLPALDLARLKLVDPLVNNPLL